MTAHYFHIFIVQLLSNYISQDNSFQYSSKYYIRYYHLELLMFRWILYLRMLCLILLVQLWQVI